MTGRAFCRQPTDHGWRHGDLLIIDADYGSVVSVTNTRTGEPKTLLASQIDRVPERARLRADMRRAVEDSLGYMDSCNGDFEILGRDLAALALFEAMSDFSESAVCAGWTCGNETLCWSWLRGELPEDGWISFVDEELRSKIVGLANASQLWWADYAYAVPLADWVDEHGDAPGVTVRRPAVTP